MKRLYHIIALVLSLTFFCLGTGMTQLHICSDNCRMEESCPMHGHHAVKRPACCAERTAAASPDGVHVSQASTCLSLSYQADFFINHIQTLLPMVACCQVMQPVCLLPERTPETATETFVTTHAPPLTGRHILTFHSVLII